MIYRTMSGVLRPFQDGSVPVFCGADQQTAGSLGWVIGAGWV
jgi:hypothetical protein